jgi:hypothetical protein
LGIDSAVQLQRVQPSTPLSSLLHAATRCSGFAASGRRLQAQPLT